MTTHEAERYARVADGTIRAMVKSGAMESHVPGSMILVSRGDVDAWIRSAPSGSDITPKQKALERAREARRPSAKTVVGAPQKGGLTNEAR